VPEIPVEPVAPAPPEPEAVAAVPEPEPAPEPAVEAAPEEPAAEPEAEPAEEAEAEPDGEPEAVASVSRSKRKKLSSDLFQSGAIGWGNDSFLADENWEFDGHIIRDQEKKIMISMGDVIYLNVGASAGIRPKMRGAIFRVGKGIRDPFNRTRAGIQIKKVGTLTVSEQVSDGYCTAVVTNSLEPIKIGDVVKIQGK
jgi:hypothetical protein